MSSGRIVLLLRRMRDVAADACRITDGIGYDAFAADPMLNRAAAMSLLMASRAATHILEAHPDFASDHGEISWDAMRDMQGRILNDDFDVDTRRVWEMARNDAPLLVSGLDAVIDWHIQGE